MIVDDADDLVELAVLGVELAVLGVEPAVVAVESSVVTGQRARNLGEQLVDRCDIDAENIRARLWFVRLCLCLVRIFSR